ncbi:hypothetical protein [Lutispora saccharofermentans]|uniref:DUF6564 domain-containing protein n=1 Tax=Lutispora saccharofermentans TaxID=3024236 RepID=A0ABT1NBG2_9FIRM|nr:hypothetical protein [Lutispora saccharofermentans]MCQ1528599.1 hypothetical protein [Lutispora saccharofermentans]
MKAIILAADGKTFNIKGEDVPKCFLPINENLTILERQIRILNFYGFFDSEIIIVIGSKGSWSKDNISEKVHNLNANILVNEENLKQGNKYSLLIALNAIEDQEVLIIDGDLVFESIIIEKLLNSRNDNILLTRNMLNPQESGSKVLCQDNRVVEVGKDIEGGMFPWAIYSGIAKISNRTLKDLKLALYKETNYDMVDGIKDILKDNNFIALDYLDLVYGNATKEQNNKLVGGSYANLRCKLIVKKEARNEGKEKLSNEIKWLLDLPAELKTYFPEVLNYKISNEVTWFEMPYYSGKNLRELIMLGEFDAKNTVNFLERLLDWMFKKIYSRRIGKAPKNWVYIKHIARVNQRLIEACQKSLTIAKMIKSDYIVLNGTKYRNIPELFLKITKRPSLIDALTPEALSMVHGDLHFQNILIEPGNNQEFLLADPRGEIEGSDIYYDMGKLWHSFNGKYDFLHTDQFVVDLKWREDTDILEANLELTNKSAMLTYDEICKRMEELLTRYEYIKNDPYWHMKTLFAEVSHFSSVMPFHIKGNGDDRRAIAMYLTAVKLINQFYDNFQIENWKEEITFYNVNSVEDYNMMMNSMDMGGGLV